MSLFLIRHAHAVDATEDSRRPLSKRGRQQVRAMAAFLRSRGLLDVPVFWHSPLARAVETAELLAKHLRYSTKLIEVAGLEGADDPALIARRLATRRAPLALVGHEPHLSALASLLVTGVPGPSRFIFKKAAVLALDRVGGVWAVRWQISPEIICDK